MSAIRSRPIILIVDDERAIRSLLGDVFVEAGYEVMLAKDGQTALQALGQVMPDLVTLDMEMPGIGGAQLLKLLDQRGLSGSLTILVISSEECIPPHVYDMAEAVVPKPFEIGQVLTLVSELVPPPSEAALPDEAVPVPVLVFRQHPAPKHA